MGQPTYSLKRLSQIYYNFRMEGQYKYQFWRNKH